MGGLLNPKDRGRTSLTRPAETNQGGNQRRWYDPTKEPRLYAQDMNRIIAQPRTAADYFGVEDVEGDDHALRKTLQAAAAAPFVADGSTALRSRSERPADIPNLLEWQGADPTGNHDNRSYIVAAIAQANTSKRMVVQIPGGDWAIDTSGGVIDIPEGVGVVGPWTGHQVRDPAVSTQGNILRISSNANSVFRLNRGSRLRGFAVYYHDQPINTLTPLEFPFFITHGPNGAGRAIVEDIRALNCDKFLKNGDAATGVAGGNLFLDNIAGSFFRQFVQQENSASFSWFKRILLSSVFGPGDAALSAQFQHANLVAFLLEGFNDGLELEIQGNRIFQLIKQTNVIDAANGLNFGRVRAMIDGCHQAYVTDGNCGPRNLLWDNCFFRLLSVYDSVSASIGFDYTSNKAQSGKTNVTYSNCILRGATGSYIRVAGTVGIDRLSIGGGLIENWAQNSGAAAGTPAVLINRAATDLVLHGAPMGNDVAGTKVGIELAAARQVDIATTLATMATAVKVSGPVTQMRRAITVVDCRSLDVTSAGSIGSDETPSRLNYIPNPSFDDWSGGTSFQPAANTDTALSNHWKARRSGSGTPFTISRQAGFADAAFCMRVQRDAGQTSTSALRIWVQLDPVVVRRFAGKNITISFAIRAGADLSSTNLQIGVHTGTAGTEKVDMSTSAATAFATGGAVVDAATQTIGAARRVVVAPIAVPPNALDLAVRFGWSGSGTAGAADLWEMTNVQLEIGSDGTPYRVKPSDVGIGI